MACGSEGVAEGLTEKVHVRHHHVYSPADNAHIVLFRNSKRRWRTVAFKLSDRPRILPGTGPAGK
jgi:hypothetical protein